MSRTRLLLRFVLFAAIAAAAASCIGRIQRINTYTRSMAFIRIGMANDKCVLLETGKSLPDIQVQLGDTVRWNIVGNCPGHTISIDQFKLVKGESKKQDPRTNLGGPRQTDATSNHTIEATMSSDKADQGTYEYQVILDGRQPIDASRLILCAIFPCGKG